MELQREFAPAVEEAKQRLNAYFAERLLAIYLTGSVSHQDAIVGESDLDLWGVVDGELSDENKAFLSKDPRRSRQSIPYLTACT